MSLTYSTDTTPGFTRKRAGKGFSYLNESGKPIRDKDTVSRINALGIPPAYTAVWINPDPTGHIQATGRDAKNRKQYRYHAEWNANQDATKFTHMLHFAQILPKLRRKVRALAGLRAEEATVVILLTPKRSTKPKPTKVINTALATPATA